MFFSLFVHIFLPEISRWVLHHAQDRAQSFGLWGIAGFIGSCLGPLVAGGVLWLFPGASRAMWRMGRMGGWGLKMAIQRYLRNRWDMLTSTIHKSFFCLVCMSTFLTYFEQQSKHAVPIISQSLSATWSSNHSTHQVQIPHLSMHLSSSTRPGSE